MNQDDVKEFLTICLMCGDGVPAGQSDEHPDLVQQYLEGGHDRWDVLQYCHDEELWSKETVNQAGVAVFYVTQKGLELLK